MDAPGNISWGVTATALVLLMTPGVAFFYGGLVKAKSVISMMMQSFGAIGLIGVLWVIFGYAIPSFLFAVLLVVLFCGGSFWQIFPLRGIVSDNFADLSWPHKILDYLWHITLPVTSLVLGSFATSTLSVCAATPIARAQSA